MLSRLPEENISAVFQRALNEGIVNKDVDTAVIFYDLSHIKERVDDLINLFPKTTLHAIAIKANPLIKILKLFKKWGAGLEAATLPELYMAEKTGLPPDKIVYDSPVKTSSDLEYALRLGVHINADSLMELKRIDESLKKTESNSTIGIRINPQVGTGKISSTSVAGEYSKFGVPLNEYREEIVDSFLKHEWLSGIHLHVGSQGCEVELLLSGAEKVLSLTNEINKQLKKTNSKRRINIFDIGGGLPVSYHRNIEPVPMSQYRDELKSRFGELFTDKFKLITEFGRYIHANAGWTASRVEYVKRDRNINTLMIHVGADLFIRKCLNPDDWHHVISIFDYKGELKTGNDSKRYNIAGPLCFAGDFIARGIELPVVEEGDYAIIHNTGAYTLSIWSRYNSRQIPKVIGYYNDGEKFEILKERERPEDLYEFWG
ncbi:MAG: diaminopimelate decarboxylase [candidate division Zixibacteria bacterium]|nr:diaminopimelate decarboxylase [candidate division Zixibacteria bacterium]